MSGLRSWCEQAERVVSPGERVVSSAVTQLSCFVPGELQKMRYAMNAATKGEEHFAPTALGPDTLEVLEWQASRSDCEIRAFREKMPAALELADEEQRESGLLEGWWSEAGPDVQKVAGGRMIDIPIDMSNVGVS